MNTTLVSLLVRVIFAGVVTGAAVAMVSVRARADSLWNNAPGGGRSLVADVKAARAGDIVTILVQEAATAQNSQKTSADKSSGASSAITQFLFPLAASKLGSHNGELPGTSYSGSNDFASNGEVNNKNTLTGRAAVLVTDVLPNGNLVLEGVRVVVAGGEKQFIVLSGIIRPQDITAANTVLSSNVANARIEFLSEGKITDSQRKGWLTKIYETLRLY